MSNRTSGADKAIRLAWANEKQLVLEGKGTRNWTPEQQKDILEKGKAYGDDGKAFEGHHMKSAEVYPEYQGEAGNIQFLSREEHLLAHNGYTRNSTNGYYDSLTGETTDFGENSYEPCEVTALTEPIVIENAADKIQNATDVATDTENGGLDSITTDFPNNSDEIMDSTANRNHSNSTNRVEKSKISHKQAPKRGSGGITRFVNKTVRFFGFETLGDLGLATLRQLPKIALGAAAIYAATRSTNSSDEEYESSSDLSYPDYSADDTDDFDVITNEYPEERSSPSEHIVPGHGQHYHTKDNGIIWKEKDPYLRGKKSDD